MPVVSPDSYLKNRHVDGVDPNRDFVNQKSVIVRNIQKFVQEQKFDAIISGHAAGRVYLSPYGDKNELCPNHSEFTKVIKGMMELSNYKTMRVCQNYGRPIFGTECDWYYKQGAFAIIAEYGHIGTHQKIPTIQEIETEFNKTYKAALYFIENAPEVDVKTPNPIR